MEQTTQERIRPLFISCFSAIRAPELYRNFAIHLFVMLPAAVVMCALAATIDHRLDTIFPVNRPLNVVVGGVLIAAGGLWVWYVYGYLYLAGGGSPGTHVDGGPVRMVDTGPYTVIRHPSVIGKLMGVTGLGIIWQSLTFLVVFLPILLLYSLISNRLLQERFCIERFGEKYEEYRVRVPMLIPRPSGIRRWWGQKPALQTPSLNSVASQPPGVWLEFRWYLVGLLGLIFLFGAFAAGNNYY